MKKCLLVFSLALIISPAFAQVKMEFKDISKKVLEILKAGEFEKVQSYLDSNVFERYSSGNLEKIWKNVMLRIIFSFLLIISIEKYIIIITSFHSYYLPSSWTMYSDLGIYPSNSFLKLLFKIIMFLIFVGIYYQCRHSRRHQKTFFLELISL